MCWELVKSKGMPCQSPKRVSSTSPARQAIRSHSLAHKSACDLSWASDIEPGTVEQAARTARLPVVEAHVALMPDAHVGVGSTVGSVIPTRGAIIPSCVGVDIDCGMVASETSLTGRQEVTTTTQLGTFGSGNHFGEVCLGGRDRVWTVLHSGSRGIGNQLSVKHIEATKGLMRERFISLQDPDLAYLVQGEPSFEAYIADMLWAQSYAMGSRTVMPQQLRQSLFEVVGSGEHVRTINCQHNFTQLEHHHGKELWITRKRAIKAAAGDEGVIPGSIRTRSYVVSGKGSAASTHSCSHGAGRRMSRGQARRELTVDSLRTALTGRSWNADAAEKLVDEHPSGYKDIDQVMADPADLVTIQHTLSQVFNDKGV